MQQQQRTMRSLQGGDGLLDHYSGGALVAHHGGKLLVAHFAVAVEVRLADHLVDLLLAQVLAQGRHHLIIQFVLI